MTRSVLTLATVITLFAGSALAQGIERIDVRLNGAAGQPMFTLSDGPTRRGELDFPLFLAELGAYVTKEILSDSGEEFTRSPIPSRLSREMPASQSEFGSHCLVVVGRLRTALPEGPKLGSTSSSSGGMNVLRAASGLLAVRHVWSAFRNHVKDDRSGFSLDPKVSTRRVGLYLTLHF